jgi:tRNA G18 (ribose-2'-O)-methylase SpoU
MKSTQLAVIAHNIRSTHNVGSIFRTCDGFAVDHLYLTGYTPYPKLERDTRLPHIIEKATNDIHKTALGAEKTVTFSHLVHPESIIDSYRAHGYEIIALEQHENSELISEIETPKKALLILGEEVNGVPNELLRKCTQIVEIPMEGKKESFNVSVATGIALYALRTGVHTTVKKSLVLND